MAKPSTLRRNIAPIKQTVAVRPEILPDYAGATAITDAALQGELGAIERGAQDLWHRATTFPTEPFDPVDHIKPELMGYATFFEGAKTVAEVTRREGVVRELQDSRIRQGMRGWKAGLGGELVASVFSPSVLVAGPLLKGVGTVKGLALGTSVLGTANAGLELGIESQNPLQTRNETYMNMGFGFALTGVIGAGVGSIGKTAARAARQQARAPLVSVPARRAALDLGSYVQRIRVPESGGAGARAYNRASGAAGPDQFLASTWMGMVKNHRPELLKGRSKAQILEMRYDPQVSGEMALQFARNNGAYLQKNGFKVDHGTLYLAHHLGAAGAVKALRAAPDTPMTRIFNAKEASANPTQAKKSAGQFIDWAYNAVGGKASGAPVSRTGGAESIGNYLDIADGKRTIREVEVAGQTVPVRDGADQANMVEFQVRVPQRQVDDEFTVDRPQVATPTARGPDDGFASPMRLEGEPNRIEGTLATRLPEQGAAKRLLPALIGREPANWIGARVAKLEGRIEAMQSRIDRTVTSRRVTQWERNLKEDMAEAQREILHLEREGTREGYSRSASLEAGENVAPAGTPLLPAMQALADKQGVKAKRVDAVNAVARLGYHKVTLAELNRFADVLYDDLSSASPTARFQLPEGRKLTRNNVKAELRARRDQRLLKAEQERVAAVRPASLAPTAEPVPSIQLAHEGLRRQLLAIDAEEDALRDALELIRSRKAQLDDGNAVLVDARLPSQRERWMVDEAGTPYVTSRGIPVTNPRFIPPGSKRGSAPLDAKAIYARLRGIPDRVARLKRLDGYYVEGRWHEELSDLERSDWDESGNVRDSFVDEEQVNRPYDEAANEAGEGALIGEARAGEPWNDPTVSPAQRDAYLNQFLAKQPTRARPPKDWNELVEQNIAAMEAAQREFEIERMVDDWDLEDLSRNEIEEMFDALPQFDPADVVGFSSPARANDLLTFEGDTAFASAFSHSKLGAVGAPEMAKWLSKNAKTKFGRMLAGKLGPLLKGVEVRTIDGKDWHYGDAKHPVDLRLNYGQYQPRDGARGRIWMNAGKDGGMSEATFLHEAIHAVLIDALGAQGYRRKGALNPILKEVEGLRQIVSEQLSRTSDADLRGMGIDPSDGFFLKYGADDLDEFITMAMSSEPFAKFLSSMQAGEKTLWASFRDMVRRTLRLSVEDDTMLDLVMRKGLRAIDQAGGKLDAGVWRGSVIDTFASPRRPVGEELEGISIDARAVRNSFNNKDYVGQYGIPDGSFIDEGDYRSFTLYAAQQQRLTPDMPPGRVGELAFERLEGDRAEHVISASALENASLMGMPVWQVKQILPEGSDFMRDFLELGTSYEVMTATNRGLAGKAATAPGGSVAQKVDNDRNRQRAFTSELLRAYDQYLSGTRKPGMYHTVASIMTSKMVNKVKGAYGDPVSGKMSEAQFGTELMRYLSSTDRSQFAPELAKAADEWVKVMKFVDAEGRRVGFFDITKQIDHEIRVAERDLSRAIDPNEIANLERTIAELQVRRNEPVMPAGEVDYWPRVFQSETVRVDEEGPRRLRSILESGYRSNRGGNLSPQEAAAAADGAISRLLLEPDSAMLPGIGPSAKHRDLPVSNLEVIDFLVTNPEVLMFKYLQRSMSSIRMIEKYGDPYALDFIDGMRADLLDKGAVPEDAERLLQLFEDQRDRIIGAFHGDSPLSLGNRTARAVRNASSLTTMGSVIQSQLSDPVKAAFIIGLKPLFIGFRRRLDPLLREISKDELLSTMAGHSDELWAMRPRAQMLDDDTSSQLVKGTGIERLLARAQVPLFIINLMGPAIVALKDAASFGVGNIIMRKSIDAAEAIQAGRAIDEKDMNWLRSHGIGEYEAQLLASMPHQMSPAGLIHPNAKAWAGPEGERARSVLVAAANGLFGRSIITPTGMDRIAAQDGILHTRKGREAQLAVVADAQAAVDGLSVQISEMKRTSSPVTMIEAAGERLLELKGDLLQQRKLVAQKGRIEAPLMTLPLQLKSFSIASAPKTVHALLSGRDRSQAGMVLSMMGAGLVATYWKAGEAWKYMDVEEIIYQSIDNSGLTAWFSDPVEAAANLGTIYEDDEDGAFSKLASPMSRASDDADFTDVAGTFGPSFGMASLAIEAFGAGDADKNERLDDARRIIPFGNVIWWKKTLQALFDANKAEQAGKGGGNGGGQDSDGNDAGRNPSRYKVWNPEWNKSQNLYEPPAQVEQPDIMPEQAAALGLMEWQARFAKPKRKKKTRARRRASALSAAAE